MEIANIQVNSLSEQPLTMNLKDKGENQANNAFHVHSRAFQRNTTIEVFFTFKYHGSLYSF